MTQPVPLAEIWRGEFLESVHLGHAVICNGAGEIVQAWGNRRRDRAPALVF